jgi:hypothetical protein
MSANPGYETGVKPLVQAAQPIPAGVDIGHVHLRAGDLARIRAFYVDILPPPPRLQHLGVRRRQPAAAGRDRPLPRRHPLPDARRPGRRLPAPGRRRLAARRLQRPRHARGPLPPRPGGERARAVLGPAARGMVGARRRRPPHLCQPAARPRRSASRGPRLARVRLGLQIPDFTWPGGAAEVRRAAWASPSRDRRPGRAEDRPPGRARRAGVQPLSHPQPGRKLNVPKRTARPRVATTAR